MFILFLNLPPGNCPLGCSLFIRFPNLLRGNCRLGVQQFPNLSAGDCWSDMRPVFTVSAPYFLQETLGQGQDLFIRLQNLPQRIGPLVVQPVYNVSKPTNKGLSDRGAAY